MSKTDPAAQRLESIRPPKRISKTYKLPEATVARLHALQKRLTTREQGCAEAEALLVALETGLDQLEAQAGK